MELVTDKHHLLRRKGIFYYRRRVPDRLQAVLGKKIIQHSLKTSDKATARKLRTIEDLKFDAVFEEAEKKNASPIAQMGVFVPDVSIGALTEHVRSFVERNDGRSEKTFITDAPASQDELEAMRQDADQELSILLNLDDPRRHELIHHAGERALRSLGSAWPEDMTTSLEFASVVQRALVELCHRRLARYDNLHDRDYFDNLFRRSTKSTATFKDIAAQYLQEKSDEGVVNGFTQKRLDKIFTNIALIQEIVGKDTPVSEIDYDASKRVQSLLASMPANRTKFYPTLSIEQAIKQGAEEGRSILSAITQTQYLDTFRDTLQLALRKKLIAYNPAEGLQALKRDTVADEDKRRPWSLDQIQTFFQSSFYRSCAPEAEEPYNRPDREWRFWLPLVCLFMGLRPNEACQLLLRDVKQTKSGTWYLDVDATDLDNQNKATAKSLKTAASRRRVPLHPELIKIGFLPFLERRRKTKETRLFSNLKADKYGNLATYALKRFRDSFIPAAVILEQRQTFYSLRHSFRDALRRCEAPPSALQALAGWSQGKLVSDNYGDPADPDYQHQWMSKVGYPGLDLSFLHMDEKKPAG